MSRNERSSGNTGLPHTSDGGRRQSSQRSGKRSDNDPLRQKIDTVKNVTNWPDEDIIRVLEKCNLDEELAMNNILDGLEGQPNIWNEVQGKRSKAEASAAKRENVKGRSEHKDSPSGARGSKNPRKATTDSSVSKEDREKTDQRKRRGSKASQASENGREPKDSSVEQAVQSTGREASKVVKDTNPSTNLAQASAPPAKIPSQWDQKRSLSEQIYHSLQNAAQSQAQQQQQQQVVKTEIHQQITPANTIVEQPGVRSEQAHQDSSDEIGGEAAQGSYNNYGSVAAPSRQYHPPGINKTWKPKEGGASPKTPSLNSTDTLVEQSVAQLVNTVPPISTLGTNNNIPSTRTAINIPQQTYSTPVILPTRLQAHSDAQDVLFGNFSGDNDEKANTTKISSNGEGKVHQIGGSSNRGNGEQEQHLRIVQEHEVPSRVDQPEVHGPSHLSNQSLAAGGYGGYLPTRPGHFAMPPYGAAPHYSYDSTEVHYAGYETVPDAQAQAMQMRPGMMPYDPQAYQPTSQYQREPSPSTDTKYLSGAASRDNAQNSASGYRENKFSSQDGSSGGTPANSTQGTHAATQNYPYPMYTYPYGMPNQLQYASSQYPQHPGHPGHQQYFPRYYRPTPYPNYSGNVSTINTAGYPSIPAGPTTTPSYTEDMVQADYKNMFPGAPFFHSGDSNLGNIMGKQTPSTPVGQQGTAAPQQGSKQSFSNSQSANVPSTGGTSPDLATGAYKNQQQTAGYQNTSIPPRDTSAPNSFYNIVQQPQYGQQTSTSFPYGTMHNMQAPQQYRGQQQYQS